VEGWIPDSREGATLTSYQKKIHLIGGLSRSILNQVLEFSLGSLKWRRIEILTYKLEPMYGHTAVQGV
jgi:hypothetical protein